MMPLLERRRLRTGLGITTLFESRKKGKRRGKKKSRIPALNDKFDKQPHTIMSPIAATILHAHIWGVFKCDAMPDLGFLEGSPQAFEVPRGTKVISSCV